MSPSAMLYYWWHQLSDKQVASCLWYVGISTGGIGTSMVIGGIGMMTGVVGDVKVVVPLASFRKFAFHHFTSKLQWGLYKLYNSLFINPYASFVIQWCNAVRQQLGFSVLFSCERVWPELELSVGTRTTQNCSSTSRDIFRVQCRVYSSHSNLSLITAWSWRERFHYSCTPSMCWQESCVLWCVQQLLVMSLARTEFLIFKDNIMVSFTLWNFSALEHFCTVL